MKNFFKKLFLSLLIFSLSFSISVYAQNMVDGGDNMVGIWMFSDDGTQILPTDSVDIDFNEKNLDNGAVIYLNEQAEASADITGQGQFWVDTATPNIPYFTDDAGTDWQLGLGGGGGGATTALDNLAAVAINTSLLPGVANAIDWGSEALFGRKIYIASDISFEGATDNDFQTTLTVTDPTVSDKTITFQDADGIVAMDATAVTDLEGTALSITTGTLNVTEADPLSATKALDNLVSVAISESLVSDTALTDDLGTEAIPWLKQYLGSSISFEGATDNDYQTTFSVTDPTADRTVTFPDADVTLNAAGDLSGGTLAAGVLASSLTSVGTLASLVATTADINAGTFDGTIGGTTPADGSFTTLSATGNVSLDAGAGNAPILYLIDGDDKYLAFNKLDAGEAQIVNNEGALHLMPSADTNDYLSVSTTTNVVTLETIANGDGDLVIKAGGGDISFDNDNLITTGTLGAGVTTLGTASSATGQLVYQNSTNANTVTLQSGATSGSYTMTLPLAIAGAGEVLTDAAGNGVLSWAAADGGANAVLSNLTAGSVAINTSLVSDTDITDDLGTGDVRWKDTWFQTLSAGLTATDTLKLRGYDVDGTAYVDILTITSANTVTADLSSTVTIGGNAILDATSTTSALTTVGALTSGSLGAGFTDVPIAQGGTGASTLAGASIPTYTSTNTFTNKRITSRVKTFASDATPDIDSDDYDAVTITAQTEAITDVNVTGTPTNFQKLTFRIRDDNDAGGYAITWGGDFEDAGVALPIITVADKILTVGFIYNTVTSKWGCVAVANET